MEQLRTEEVTAEVEDPLDMALLAMNGLKASIAEGYMTNESAVAIHKHYFPDAGIEIEIELRQAPHKPRT